MLLWKWSKEVNGELHVFPLACLGAYSNAGSDVCFVVLVQGVGNAIACFEECPLRVTEFDSSYNGRAAWWGKNPTINDLTQCDLYACFRMSSTHDNSSQTWPSTAPFFGCFSETALG